MKQEIIYTEYYALIVSDEHIKEGDFNVPSDFDRTSDISITSEEDLEVVNDRFNGYKKVIAHKPLTDAPILEGVPLLPDWEETEETIKSNYYNELEDRREVARNFSGQVAGRHPDMFGHSEIHHMVRGFIDGYNKAKETYKYTEDDLIRAIELSKVQDLKVTGFGVATDFKNTKEYIVQSLQQVKRPKYFECEMEDTLLLKNRKGGNTIMAKPKTITNPQGQTELVGDYIYEKDFTPNEEIFSQFKK